MLKIPKGLKKKKKGKKSKRKGEDELFTEEELEKYRKEHQQQAETGAGQSKENEEWSKFKDLTKGVDSILLKTQGDLDRIKSTSFFQREPTRTRKVDATGKEIQEVEKPPTHPRIQVPVITEADFKREPETDGDDKSEYGVTDDESDDEEDDDIFDTSYVEAVERGEVKLTYVPDSPEELQDDSIFDTSYVEAVIKGKEEKKSEGKKAINIGVAVEVLTGRIDNIAITRKRPKRVIPGDLLFDEDQAPVVPAAAKLDEPSEKSILDADTDIPIPSEPIDLSVSLHTQLIKKEDKTKEDVFKCPEPVPIIADEEDDEFSKLAAESLEITKVVKVEEKDIVSEPVLQESWSAFEADKNENVFAESIVEDQIDIVDPFIDQADPFDTSFVEQLVPKSEITVTSSILEEDDDFDPRADEIKIRINNRRKSSVHIHLTDPSGLRESITSENESLPRDLLGGSTSDLTLLNDAPLDPIDTTNEPDFIDPFDTTIIDKIVVPGKQELKYIEKELISNTPSIHRVESDPDFDPRAEEQKEQLIRRPSRPENLVVNKSVVFANDQNSLCLDSKGKPSKPVTPYYTRDVSITEDVDEEEEGIDKVSDTLPRSLSNQDLSNITNYQSKRRHSEYPTSVKINIKPKALELLESIPSNIRTKVLTPCEIENSAAAVEVDPFDTSFAGLIQPTKTELKLLTKEFSCEDKLEDNHGPLGPPEDNIFQTKPLTPEPTDNASQEDNDYDPFDTSTVPNLQPGRTEIKLLESEFLN